MSWHARRERYGSSRADSEARACRARFAPNRAHLTNLGRHRFRTPPSPPDIRGGLGGVCRLVRKRAFPGASERAKASGASSWYRAHSPTGAHTGPETPTVVHTGLHGTTNTYTADGVRMPLSPDASRPYRRRCSGTTSAGKPCGQGARWNAAGRWYCKRHAPAVAERIRSMKASIATAAP